MTRLENLINEVLQEEKEKRDRCLRIADRKYDKPSAYKSGAVVKCRKGMIWKGLKEADEQITLCSMELDQPLSVEEASEIIADMMVLNIHKTACEKALTAAKEFIKKNRFVLN